MRLNFFRTYWVVFLSLMYTAYISFYALFNRIFHYKMDRPWVDKTIFKWAVTMLDLIKARRIIYNPHNVKPIPGKATIIMCNHTSMYDIPLGFLIFPEHSVRMLAKKELSKIPVLNTGMRSTEFPFIDRKNRTQAFKDLAYARKLMESGIIIWIAPEGTRSRDGKLKPFKKGAFITAIESKATIIPVGIRGAFEILPPDTWRLNFYQTAEIHIGKPIDAAEYTISSKEELVKKVHASMEELVGAKQFP